MNSRIILALFFIALLNLGATSQDSFTLEEYVNFRNSTVDISSSQLQGMYPMPYQSYYQGFENTPSIYQAAYLDTIIDKLGLTEDELSLLEENRFFVTERLSPRSFGDAFHYVYNYDLPVFISTDAVLHALHSSYDRILKSVENELMLDNLEQFLEAMFNSLPALKQKYQGNELLETGVKDAALYVTIAYSLIKEELQHSDCINDETALTIWNAITNETMVSMPLFTFDNNPRTLDFSQFKVRGHYVYTQDDQWRGLLSLEAYFKAMMWLGRIDFFLTPPPKNPWEREWNFYDHQRMNIGAYLLNELFQNCPQADLLRQNEEIINYLVGESDNATPKEYQTVVEEQGITSAEQLTDSLTMINFFEALFSYPELVQKILSSCLFADPDTDTPGEFPISFKLSGQRFIVDSYVFSSVVYDRVIFQGEKIMRMMPHPFDALFALGNNDALPFLQNELDSFNYSTQLANMRYLIDHYDQDQWDASLYNVWLSTIRELNPTENEEGLPLFMKTTAWHQEKMNTQLASWAQLRHDNLLYAKQSYTSMAGCSFPHSYVEPYPEFYSKVQQFAKDAGNFFSQIPSGQSLMNHVVSYFSGLSETMGKLEQLAQKELNGEAFSDDEIKWLQTMLFTAGGSGAPPYSGWYIDLFFDHWDASEDDYTIADIHTQPTDKFGNPVGKILHVGVGDVNLGVFIANCPGMDGQEMAYIGPVMSYYEKITQDFLRLTDQYWSDMVKNNDLPDRPDWTNIYLAGNKGESKELGSQLPSMLYTSSDLISNTGSNLSNLKIYPNPVKNSLNINFTLQSSAKVSLKVKNIYGKTLINTPEHFYMNGLHSEKVSLESFPSGMYLITIYEKGKTGETIKIIKQ